MNCFYKYINISSIHKCYLDISATHTYSSSYCGVKRVYRVSFLANQCQQEQEKETKIEIGKERKRMNKRTRETYDTSPTHQEGSPLSRESTVRYECVEFINGRRRADDKFACVRIVSESQELRVQQSAVIHTRTYASPCIVRLRASNA